ncbi:hypothetical protein EDD36DRAFT_415959 [Exophiala viscosa]|uniref:Uncharacterized protein n=1 Tax=Exophiala viscosa TaxID=2486360 RepID=A0AAN6IJ28_9EURO|nr:hypothetical protein EDD36DRAFT_415959 [Exophiala viscosa]
MSSFTTSSSYCSPASSGRWATEGLYSDTSSDKLNYVAGDFNRSPTRSTNSIFGYPPSLLSHISPPSPRSRRQPTLRTPIVRSSLNGPWLRAAESPRRRRQSPIERPSPTPGPVPFHYRRAPSVESPYRMPSVSPLPLVESPPPLPKLKAFSRWTGLHVSALHPGPTVPPKPQHAPRLRQTFSPRCWRWSPSPPRLRVKAFPQAGPHVSIHHPGPTIPRVPEISTRLRQAFPPEVWKSMRSPPPRPRIKAFSRAGSRFPSRAVLPCPTVAPSKASPRRQPITPRQPSPPTDTSAPAPTTARQGVRRVRISGRQRLSRTGTSTTPSATSSSQGDFDPDAAFVDDSSVLESPIPDSPTVTVISSRTQPNMALDSTPGFFARCGQILDTTVTKVLGWVRSWF